MIYKMYIETMHGIISKEYKTITSNNVQGSGASFVAINFSIQ